MKNKTVQHTTTPWILDTIGVQTTKILGESKHREFIDPMTGHEGIDHSPELLARVSTFSDEGKANAARIVKAVNCHEELVKTLKSCVASLKRDTEDFGHEVAHINYAIRDAEQALARAEEI